MKNFEQYFRTIHHPSSCSNFHFIKMSKIKITVEFENPECIGLKYFALKNDLRYLYRIMPLSGCKYLKSGLIFVNLKKKWVGRLGRRDSTINNFIIIFHYKVVSHWICCSSCNISLYYWVSAFCLQPSIFLYRNLPTTPFFPSTHIINQFLGICPPLPFIPPINRGAQVNMNGKESFYVSP